MRSELPGELLRELEKSGQENRIADTEVLVGKMDETIRAGQEFSDGLPRAGRPLHVSRTGEMKKILIVDDDTFVTAVYNKFPKRGILGRDRGERRVGPRNDEEGIVGPDSAGPAIAGPERRGNPQGPSSGVLDAKTAGHRLFQRVFGVLVEAAWKAGANQLLTKAQCTPNAGRRRSQGAGGRPTNDALAMKLKEHIRLLAQGGPGFVQMALTNACNARCRFCNFSQIKPEDQVNG